MSDMRKNLLLTKIPGAWATTQNGKVKMLIFEQTIDKKLCQYQLREGRKDGVDYLFSFDKILSEAINTRKTNDMRIYVKNALITYSSERFWVTADKETSVIGMTGPAVKGQSEKVFSKMVEGTGQVIEGEKLEIENPIQNKVIDKRPFSKENIGFTQNDKDGNKETFNVYITNPMQNWEVSKFQKRGLPTAVKKLKFKRADGKDGILNHNMHFEKRMGGQLMELFKEFDKNMQAALAKLTAEQTLLIKNVTYGWWRFPGANPNKDWIFPTENTTIVPIKNPKLIAQLPVKKKSNNKVPVVKKQQQKPVQHVQKPIEQHVQKTIEQPIQKPAQKPIKQPVEQTQSNHIQSDNELNDKKMNNNVTESLNFVDKILLEAKIK